MTTIITRLYADHSAADAAVASLQSNGQVEYTIHIITKNAEAGPDAAMKAARVGATAAAAYSTAMTGDEALLVVQAPFNPMGAARNAIKILQKHPAMNAGVGDEDVYLREYPSPQYSSSILAKHPLVASNPFREMPHGHIFGNNPIIHSKPRTSAMRGGGYMSRFFWPMKLVSAPKTGSSAIRGTFLVSSMFGLPLLFRSWVPREELPTIIR